MYVLGSVVVCPRVLTAKTSSTNLKNIYFYLQNINIFNKNKGLLQLQYLDHCVL